MISVRNWEPFYPAKKSNQIIHLLNEVTSVNGLRPPCNCGPWSLQPIINDVSPAFAYSQGHTD